MTRFEAWLHNYQPMSARRKKAIRVMNTIYTVTVFITATVAVLAIAVWLFAFLIVPIWRALV